MVFVLVSMNLKAQQTLDSTQSLKEVAVEAVIKPAPVFRIEKLDKALLESQPQLSIDNALKFQTNLMVRDYGSGALSSISFRGYGSRHTAVFWEDMPVVSSMNKTFDGSLFPTFMANEVSVQYGASGMINGTGGLGGTLVFQSTPSFEDTLKFALEQTISSINNGATGIKIQKSSKRWFSTTHFFSRYESNEFRYMNPIGDSIVEQRMKGAGNQILSGQQKLAYKLNEKSVLTWNLFLQSASRRLPHLTSQTGVSESQKDNSLFTNLVYTTYLKNAKLKVVGGMRTSGLQYINSAINVNDVGQERTAFVQTRISYVIGKFDLENALLYNEAFAVHPEYNGWRRQCDVQHIMRARYSWKQFLFHGLIKSQIIDTVILPLLPSVGVAWKSQTDWLQVKTNAAYHAMAPSLNDLYWSVGGNPNLVPEKGWTTELSFASERDTGLNYELTGFWSRIEDRILWQPEAFGVWQASNISTVTNYGFEATGRYTNYFSANVKLNSVVNYSYNEAFDAKNQQLAYLPKHRVSVFNVVDIKKIQISYGHRFTGLRYLNSGNTSYLPSYFNATASVNYKLEFDSKNKVTLGVTIENLYNEPYQEVANRPMPNRYFLFNIKYFK